MTTLQRSGSKPVISLALELFVKTRMPANPRILVRDRLQAHPAPVDFEQVADGGIAEGLQIGEIHGDGLVIKESLMAFPRGGEAPLPPTVAVRTPTIWTGWVLPSARLSSPALMIIGSAQARPSSPETRSR